MKVGYARVSTDVQNLDLQIDELKKEGCTKFFYDTISGASFERKGLDEALEFMRQGDVFVVWKLDRLGRSVKFLIEIVNSLSEKGIEIKSLRDPFKLDTTSPEGKLIFHVFAALAEYERGLITERTIAGLASARARGRVGGRPKIMDESKTKMAQMLHADKNNKIDDICKMLGVSRTTFYRNLKKDKLKVIDSK